MFYSIHASTWLLVVILFILSITLRKNTILKILLRISYLVMLTTGIIMLVQFQFPGIYITKGLLAIFMIGTMETLLARKKKGKSSYPIWILFVFLLILVLLIGFNLITF
ncbi:DUF1516 family protein [Alkalihalobacillus hwajinpoensis]|uniref:DUF1516 family protein n=1 Tax=Guptibacillus hwajinpoensis TaxID=208199 RepID=UPI00188334B3|nr:DUF1516 family protein [Pseudalkalibacillus hwajinpoensis]MBF0708918.1 DUF1516 family protein [Pseudalkalibacillus hwajinpoensis]